MMGDIVKIEGSDYMRSARGDLIPCENVKEVDLLRDEVVEEIVGRAFEESRRLADFKRHVFDEADSFIELSLEKYGVQAGGRKGNVTLSTFDGEYKVIISVQDVLSFDERLEAAKELIDGCIVRWSSGANGNLRILVNDAFNVDKKGNVDTRRILELRRYRIEDAEWKRAMESIADSLKIQMSRRYIRIYRRDGDGYRMIPLMFSAV